MAHRPTDLQAIEGKAKETWSEFLGSVIAGKYTELEAIRELRDRGGARTEKDALRYYKALTSKYRDVSPELLTQEQYVESQFSPATMYNRGGYPVDVAQADHEAFVEQALSEGKSVPPKVLKDYPSLKGETKTTDLQAIHDARSPRSRESDERLSNADTIEPDDPRVEQWLKDQGQMDVVGIDTPRKGKGKKVARKARKDSGRRVGKTEAQLGGLRGK